MKKQQSIKNNPKCRYCKNRPTMTKLADDLYECPECCYELELKHVIESTRNEYQSKNSDSL